MIAKYTHEGKELLAHVEDNLKPAFPNNPRKLISVCFITSHKDSGLLRQDGTPHLFADERVIVSSDWLLDESEAWEKFRQRCAESGVVLDNSPVNLLHIG